MKIHRDINQLPAFNNAVITIGSFDGVHRGHKKIIERIKRIATDLNGESVLITFHPHPRKIIFPQDNSLLLLNTLEEKIELFARNGLDHLVIIPFSIEFSQQDPREYLDKFIMAKFSPACIVIGYDHRFGLNRKGDIYLLKEYAKEYQFKVVEIKKQEIEDITISSTKVRNALLEGNITDANLFLGYPYSISGKVVHGDKIGKQLGFPTANLSIPEKEKLIPKPGVYAASVLIGHDRWDAMLYIGDRPTINTKQKMALEVHIFHFNQDVYDMEIQVELIEYVREDVKYNSLNDLRAQLQRDAEKCLKILHEGAGREILIPEISIAILNYNGKEHLEAYLPSVIQACPDHGQVVVIDNGSDDDSLEFLEEWYPDVRIIPFENNFGFAEGYNKGMAEIKSPYVLLLNSDVKLKEDSLNVLMEVISKDKNIAGVQPLILDMEERDKYEYAGAAGGFMDHLGYPFCRGRIFKFTEQVSPDYGETDVFWISGACMLVDKKVFDQLGGFDGNYFAHQEEVDFCWRALRAGYRFTVTDKTRVYHLGGGTLSYDSPRKVFLNFRNSLITIVKNEPILKLLFILPLRIILDWIAAIYFIFQGKFYASWAIIKAHGSFLFNVRNTLLKSAYYYRLINRNRIGKRRDVKRKAFSIVFSHYILGIRKFRNL